MPLIEWSDDLSIGIDAFDREHKALVRVLNDLYDLVCADDMDVVGIEHRLRDLDAHARSHFAHEEAHMAECGSPRLESHRELHRILLDDLAGMVTQARGDGFAYLRDDLEGGIRAWLLEHIENVDKRLPGAVGDDQPTQP